MIFKDKGQGDLFGEQPEPVKKKPTGDKLKKDAIARADRHASPEWKAEADRALMQACIELKLITTDDVWQRMDPNIKTHENRALGGVVQRAIKAGWISASGLPPIKCVTRPTNHSRPLAVWLSHAFSGQVASATNEPPLLEATSDAKG